MNSPSPSNSQSNWDDQLSQALQDRASAGTLRERRDVKILDTAHIEIAGQRFINFCSNDYLGFTHHPRIIRALEESLKQNGSGAAASGLVTGHTTAHALAEEKIARWKNSQNAILTSSGYTANVAAVQSLHAASDGKARFLVDKLAHASLIDALRSAEANFRIYPHNDYTKLARLLSEADEHPLQVVLTESIFSMDGDSADLQQLAELKAKHPFLLLLDEAHGSGVYGKHGAGFAAEQNLSSIVDISIVTLSKALGLVGGAICSSKLIRDSIVNFGRSYIYSTAIPPAIASAAIAAIDVLQDEPQHQQRVRQIARQVRAKLTAAGFTLPPGDSPIVPIILGDENKTLEAAARLKQAGFYVAAIRPPTVPRGASRLRVTFSSAHRDEDVEALIAAIISICASS